MKKQLFSMFALCLSLFYFSSCSTSPQYSVDWQELQNEFQPMINMLDKGLYGDFINMYIDPRLVASKGGASAMLTEFSIDKRDQLTRVLRAAKNMQPFIDTGKGIATFDSGSFPYPLRFQKIGDRWYLLNGPAFEDD